MNCLLCKFRFSVNRRDKIVSRIVLPSLGLAVMLAVLDEELPARRGNGGVG